MIKEAENHDPFLCKCGACKRFWVVTFGDRMKILLQQTALRVKATSKMYAALAEDTTQNASIARMNKKKIKDEAPIRIGDQVITNKGYKGIVKFIGHLEEDVIAPKTFVGIQLYDQVSFSDNGIWKGKKYFHCIDGHGLIIPFNALCRCSTANKRPAISGNRMFPSYAKVNELRNLQNNVLLPHVPTAYDGSKLNITPMRNICDCNDMALKDHYKKKEKRRLDLQNKRLINDADQLAQQRAALIYKSNLEKLKKYTQMNTGSGNKLANAKRTERLAKTVLTLQKGYEIGALGKWNKINSDTDSNLSSSMHGSTIQEVSWSNSAGGGGGGGSGRAGGGSGGGSGGGGGGRGGVSSAGTGQINRSNSKRKPHTASPISPKNDKYIIKSSIIKETCVISPAANKTSVIRPSSTSVTSGGTGQKVNKVQIVTHLS